VIKGVLLVACLRRRINVVLRLKAYHDNVIKKSRKRKRWPIVGRQVFCRMRKIRMNNNVCVCAYGNPK